MGGHEDNLGEGIISNSRRAGAKTRSRNKRHASSSTCDLGKEADKGEHIKATRVVRERKANNGRN
jgi:hypothetical protein